MVEPSFGDFREGLLRAGVAPRHAYRAVVEIEAHYRELLDDETGRGVGDREARIEARRRLGTNQELVRRYVAQPELRAWSRRWPALCFTIVPYSLASPLAWVHR